MYDVEISVEVMRGEWWVHLKSAAPHARAWIKPLDDEALAEISDLPAELRTWRGFLRCLSPNEVYRPGSATLREVGGIVMNHLLGDPALKEHFTAIEARSTADKRPIRLVIEVDEADPILAALPLEMAHDGTRYFFKRKSYPVLRAVPRTDARNLRIERGARVLVATAHADSEPEPSQTGLQEHAEAILQAARAAGFETEHLGDATAVGLRARMLAPPGFDIVHVVCHGVEDEDRGGHLALRDGLLAGEELARWLEEASEEGRPVQAVILCACSSALPPSGRGTLGMAQWLARPGRALATLGFRGPVLVRWALAWSERLFDCLGKGATLEAAVAEARYHEPESEPQWALPILYGRRRDPDQPSVVHRPSSPMRTMAPDLSLPPLAATPLPRPPRSYFTGREAVLRSLHAWTGKPGTALITAIEGQGGLGKTEIAAVLAHEQRTAGRPVIWLERADKDVRAALSAMIRVREPTFEASPEALDEDLAAQMRRLLSPYSGLLVLDDVSDRHGTERLLPGGNWNVLVTSRTEGLLPGVLPIPLELLSPQEALEMLSRLAWGSPNPPDEQRDAAKHLVEALGRLPLALEMAGARLRNLVTAEEYLASLHVSRGAAAADLEIIRPLLLRTLADLEDGDKAAFLALAILPAAGATGEMVATTIDAPAPRTARRLDRLVRHHLANWSPELERYRLHPVLRAMARDLAATEPATWESLHRNGAKALEKLGAWVHAPIGTRTDLARERWIRVRDLFDDLRTEPWENGAPGGEHIGMALAQADMFRRDRPPADRERVLRIAAAVSAGDASWRRAYILNIRGYVRRFHDDLDGAASDFDDALELFKKAEDRLGQANVLKVRGDLRHFRSNLDGAASDYNDALELFKKVESRLGQANVLRARGDLRRFSDDHDGAARDYDDALQLFKSVDDRLGQANALKAIGDLRQFSGDLDGAASNYDDALELFKKVESRLGQASVLKARGDLRRFRSDFDGAASDYDDALELFNKVESRLGQASVFQARGDMDQGRGKLAKALGWYLDAVPIYRQVQSCMGLGDVLAEIAKIFALTGKRDEARTAAQEALTLVAADAHAEQVARSVLAWAEEPQELEAEA